MIQIKDTEKRDITMRHNRDKQGDKTEIQGRFRDRTEIKTRTTKMRERQGHGSD